MNYVAERIAGLPWWGAFIALAVCLFIAAELGFRLGRSARKRKPVRSGAGQVGAVLRLRPATPAALQDAIASSGKVHAELWREAELVGRAEPSSKVVGLFIDRSTRSSTCTRRA